MKPLVWVGSSKRDYSQFPEPVQDECGRALLDVQFGDMPASADTLDRIDGTMVLQIEEDYRTDTYRVVYVAVLQTAVYVLHAWKKKARHGIRTDRRDLDLIRQRLLQASAIEAERRQAR